MALLVLRRRRRRTPAERVLGLTSTAFKLIPAVRTARTTVKVVRRAPVVVGGGAIVFVVVRRLRASGDGGGGAEPYTPPAPAATTPAPAPAAPSPATSPSPVGAAGTGAPGPAGEAAGTGTPPHGDPLGAAATGDLGAGDPDSTRHGLDALSGTEPTTGSADTGGGIVPGVAPEPGPGGTSEVESGLGPVEVTTPGLPTVVEPGEVDATSGGGMVGAPDLEVPATPEGADAVNDALLGDLPPNESAPGHHPDETDKQ
jgi:hypothetical protein